MSIKEPAYLSLYRSGKLKKLVEQMEARLASCDICAWNCGINRLSGQRGFCRSGLLPVISSICAHHGEEPALSGTRGSGTIFFGNCNMRCVYCQNYQISQDPQAQEKNAVDYRELAQKMLYLQNELKCHNINLVSPSHFVPQILKAVHEAIPLGLKLPLVFNTGGFDSLETIRALEGIIDIYLPDIRYSDDAVALKYSQSPDYVSHNRAVIKEMYRQVGDLEMDENEIAVKGIIVRHLILPGDLAGSAKSLTWLAREVSPDITVSIMSQYYPCHEASQFRELSRTITYEEYKRVVDLLDELGLENGWLQEMDAPANYLPDFNREGHPFQSDSDEKTA